MTALQVFLLSLFFAFILAVIFHPQRGVLTRLRFRSKYGQRELFEDTLKFLLEQEQNGRFASAEAIAGVLGLSVARTLQLVTRMEFQGLLQTREGGLHLTSQGERWALHVVRAHRLWERYLADEARLPLEKIHAEAHRREHGMTPDEVDDLDAYLGYPEQDPHGDPIPRESEGVTAASGVPLTAWEMDKPGRIIHLEDEPPLAYAQILAEGLRLGQVLRVLEVTPERVVLSDAEQEYRLAPAVAANVFLSPVETPTGDKSGVLPLADLPNGARAEVIALDEACQGFTRRRLLDLGFTPGAKLTAEMRNFFGDPRAYRVRGALIALRKEQAAQIWVKAMATNGR